MDVALRWVLREAGASVVPNAKLRVLGIQQALRRDDRNVEAAAFGPPLFHGVTLLVDITMVSFLHADGRLLCGASAVDGVALKQARERKEACHHELVTAKQPNWWLSLAKLADGGTPKLATFCGSWVAPEHVLRHHSCSSPQC